MIRVLFSAVLILMCMNSAFTEVTLKGSVKKSGAATALAGVRVSLVKQPALFDTTDANGAFTITDGTAIRSQRQTTMSFQFTFKENVIVFSSDIGRAAGSIGIFSGSGRKILSTDFRDLQPENGKLALPDLAAGIYLIKISYSGKTFTQTFACVGNELVMKNTKTGNAGSGTFSLTKQAAAATVDTLLAEKSGYVSKKVPITSYVKDSIEISLDSSGGAGGKCTRESLKAVVDKYIEAQTAGDPTKMPLAENVKVMINGTDSSLEKGILKQALKIDFHLSIFDVDSCRTFTEVIVANSTPAYVIGTRLRVKDGKVTEISAIVTDKKNGWLFNAGDFLKYAKDQNWYVLSASERSTREKLIDAGDQYLDMFNGDFEGLPWGAPCYRIEGGAITFKSDTTADYCKVKDGELGSAKFTITKRDFIVDEDLGTVNVFCAFCKLDSHMFRLVNGHYRYVHTLTVDCK